MKFRFHVIFISLSLLTGTEVSFAQTPQQAIVEQLVEASDGTLTIILSPSLYKEFENEVPAVPAAKTNETKTNVDQASSVESTPKKALRTSGFRIQIFGDGRDQSTLQERARARAKQILEKFPKYNRQVYSFSKAPNYYTRIGNFATREEANKALNELRRAFPAFAGEIRVVQSEVILNR